MSDTAATALETAKTHHLEGRPHLAEKFYREALQTEPENAAALDGLGGLFLQTRRLPAAVDTLRKAIAAHQAVGTAAGPAANNLGVALCQLQRFEEAAAAFLTAVNADREAVVSLYNLGSVLAILGRHAEALPVMEKCVAREPGRLDFNLSLANVLMTLQRPGDAIAYFEKAAVLEPRRVDIWGALGTAQLQAGRFADAADQFRHVLSVENSPQALCGLGEAQGGMELHEEAAASFKKAINLAPDVALLHYNYGSALSFLGNTEDAAAAFERAAALAPEVPSYHYAAMAGRKIQPDDPHLAALEQLATQADRYPAQAQAELFFGLAKAYDDLSQYERAFEALKRGNDQKRTLVAYDEEKALGLMRDVEAVFTAELLAERAGQGDPSTGPVFIVGMPRSGTSLVEQILASHPAVYGAGERTWLAAIVSGGIDFPAGVPNADAGDLARLGEAYVARLKALAPQAEYITDKMPGNILYAGLIRLILPNARIVHVRRDPLDTCFSCYTKLLDGVNYAYTLPELGRYYRAYQGLAAHWRNVLPPEKYFEIDYEALTADFEPQVRRLVEWCGLGWDDRCLSFHETKRNVRTASAFQVRQPLYMSAVGRAAHYQAWLEPLRSALGMTP